MNNWSYDYKDLVEVPEGGVAFVYSIFIDNRYYIGKKNFFTKRKKHFGKKELALVTDKRKKTYHTIVTESNWKTYCSSSDEVKKLVLEGHEPTRTILRVCKTLKEATWLEERLLHRHVGSKHYINDSIRGVFHRKEIEEWI